MNTQPGSHFEYVEQLCYDAWSYKATPESLRVIKALSNLLLARHLDREEFLDRAANVDLAARLLDCGACDEGMNTVGVHASSWSDLGCRIAEAYRSEWMAWCADSCRLSDVFSFIEAGWFRVTSNSWRDYD